MRYKDPKLRKKDLEGYPEFLDWQWIELDKITKYVVDFKLDIYEIIKNKVNKIIN